MALLTYYPEMNESKPAASYEGAMSHSGRHYFITTPMVMKGRGIIFLNTLTADTLVKSAHHKIGWHQYRLTPAAFEALTASQDVSMVNLL